MKSMTGYGEAKAQGRWAKVVVQVRSLNHRHLDIQVRAPREYLSLEEEMRRIIRQKISRGRVDLFISRFPASGEGRRVELDEPLLGQYLQSLRRAQRKFSLRGGLDLSLVARLPDLFRLRDVESMGEDEKGVVLKTLQSALNYLERSREREGRQLQADVQIQVRELRKVCAGLSREANKVRRLQQSLSPLEDGSQAEKHGEGADPNWNFRGDFHEEAVRLGAHVGELGRLIRSRGAAGKKIEFLLQELQRELNTISSKAPHLPIVQMVLTGKEKVERIREQSQNLE